MRDCKCGKKVRLGAYRISVNRRKGIVHNILHSDGSAMDTDEDWGCSALKPYSKNEADRPYQKMMEKWAAQAVKEQ